jgi:DNA-binding transcriptional MerR regulator
LPKEVDAFRNIGEVSLELGVKKHVLRFWEQKFPQLKPMKRGGGRRLYRPSDVQLLKGIHHLLQNAGYKIEGVQKLLREQGIDYVKKAATTAAPGRASAKKKHPGTKRGRSVVLSAEEIGALQTVAGELEALLAVVGPQPRAKSSGHRQKRALARG